MAAARADFSESSGRRIERGKTNPSQKKLRNWRTRKDPFAEVWESEIVPLLEDKPDLCPTTLFEELQLQLLIITPAKDIHVIEPFISACHYVFNNEQGNHSQVHNMNMTQYYAQKAAFEAVAADWWKYNE